MRQTIARNMIQSYTTIPQLTNFDDADVTELEDMREQSKADYADRGIKLTAMPFVIKAVASSLKRHPMLNASVDMENNTIIYKEYVNIGIAVDTERGLVVPVLRDADRKSISQIASEIEELAGTVREGKFDLDLLKGGTFTISNLGSVGGTYSTPIINPPQVAILLVGRTPHRAAIRRRQRRPAPDDAALDHLRPPPRRRRRRRPLHERSEKLPRRPGAITSRPLSDPPPGRKVVAAATQNLEVHFRR